MTKVTVPGAVQIKNGEDEIIVSARYQDGQMHIGIEAPRQYIISQLKDPRPLDHRRRPAR